MVVVAPPTPLHGIVRLRRGKGFGYRDAAGRPVRDLATLRRIRALAIPPAWTDVVIATSAEAHIQATGRDARHRKQYRYHPRWRERRDADKYGRLVDFCRALPRVRDAVARDLRCRCLCKRKVTATLLALLESCQLRIGNDEYARQNGSHGATTLEDQHARDRGAAVELVYRGKAGVIRHVRVSDRRLAAIVRQCRAVPGKRLFQYVRDDGRPGPVTAPDVNAYLREVAGREFSAKDYRTWAATLSTAALLALAPCRTARDRRARLKHALASVAHRLGHTPTVCRASYVHPRILQDFATGALARRLGRRLARTCDRVPDDAEQLPVETLRAIEPVVASYLARSAS
jgi:DNA topoisomerase I